MVKRYSKFLASAIIIAIYSFAYLVVYYLYSELPFKHELVNILVADIVATFIVFIFSLVFSNSSVYDPYWSVVPPIIAIYLAKLFPEGDTIRQLVVILLISLWSVRLTLNWFRGWPGFMHQDWRYTNIAQKTGRMYWPVSFLGIHFMPTIFVFLGCLPLWYIMASNISFGIIDLVASIITLGAILIEWLADEQMIRFRKSNSTDTYIKSGLWSRSRHPNYFGEISFWLGLFLFVLSTVRYDAYWTAAGFIAMLILFKFISIPMMEKRNKNIRTGYDDYIKKVPALLPSLFKKYK